VKSYVRETVENSEKVVLLKIQSSGAATQMVIDHLESATGVSIDYLDSELDRCLRAVEWKGWCF